MEKYNKLAFLLCVVILGGNGTACIRSAHNIPQEVIQEANAPAEQEGNKVVKTESEWKTLLTADEYQILREKGTERAFTGKYNDFKQKGTFTCKACENPLFSSETKYDSRSGWPSFWQPIALEKIKLLEDNSLFMKRIEIVCSRCNSHLGHVFDDGPKPTGLRYCINSVSLGFTKKDK